MNVPRLNWFFSLITQAPETEYIPSTRDCVISRTPQQRMAFEQALNDFNYRHLGGIPVLILIPVTTCPRIITDMTAQLIQFAELVGRSRVVLSFGIDGGQTDVEREISKATEALYDANIIHRVQRPENLDSWTKRTLMGYRQDFKLAVVLRGVVCAIDLVRLVIETIENDADVACGVDINFGFRGDIMTSSHNINLTSGRPVSTGDLLSASSLIQTRDCDSSVMALSFGVGHNLRQFGTNGGFHGGSRIMISPSVKSSADPEDFRMAMELGLMDLHGYDDNPIQWQKNNGAEERWRYMIDKVWTG